jgi:hypothetical protein
MMNMGPINVKNLSKFPYFVDGVFETWTQEILYTQFITISV